MFGFGPRYATSDAVTLKKETVLKKVDRRFVELEVRVTRAAHDLSQTSGLFCSPRVIACDSAAGIIELERIKGVVTLGQFLAKKPDNIIILRRVGRALAHIHRHLQVSPDLRLPVASKWWAPDSDVVLMHGDFNTVNVGYKEDADVIVVWDWASAPSLGKRCTVGPRYLELAHFIHSLVAQQANFLQSIRHVRRRTNAFLKGYKDGVEQDVDLCILADFLVRFSLALLPIHTRRKSLVKRLYYTSIYLAGHVVFLLLARKWRQAGQFSAGKRTIFRNGARNV